MTNKVFTVVGLFIGLFAVFYGIGALIATIWVKNYGYSSYSDLPEPSYLIFKYIVAILFAITLYFSLKKLLVKWRNQQVDDQKPTSTSIFAAILLVTFHIGSIGLYPILLGWLQGYRGIEDVALILPIFGSMLSIPAFALMLIFQEKIDLRYSKRLWIYMTVVSILLILFTWNYLDEFRYLIIIFMIIYGGYKLKNKSTKAM